MPAQWPTFITQVSNKMSSHSPLGPDDFGMFVANEYFKAVGTAQTPFGNIHTPGQKTILEVGFKKAFNDLFDSTEPLLEDKKFLEPYSDMVEEFPVVEPYNVGLELETWVEENEDNINPFNFYEFFKKVSGDTNITINAPALPITPNILIDSVVDANSIQRKITFKGIDGGGAPYTFKYSIDGEIQPQIKTSSESDSISIDLPQFNQGDRSLAKYKLISVIGASGLEGHVNQAVDIILDNDLLNKEGDSIERDDETPLVGLNEFNLVGGSATQNTTYHKIPDMDEEQRAIGIAQRVYYQYDGTQEFINWLNRIDESPYNGLNDLSKKVKDIVLGLLFDVDIQNIETEIQNLYNSHFLEYDQTYIDSEIIRIYDERSQNLVQRVKEENTLNQKIFQIEHIDDTESIPNWLTRNLIVTFVYLPQIDATPDPFLGEITRRETKKAFYYGERTRWNNLKKEWIQSLIDQSTADSLAAENAEKDLEEDPYVVMANTVVSYWMSTITQPFNAAPPVPLCNVPSPGTYIPIYYGSKKKLASDLRKAWNTGKNFETTPTLKVATQAVASAVAVSFAKHLIELKFAYTGQLTVGTATIPMIGFVPTTF